MGRIFNAVLLTVMIVGAIVTYNMKHRAEVEADKVARLQADIAAEKEALSLLHAEWSKLSQPGRLQELVAHYADHFRLAPFVPSQSATLNEIPAKPALPGDALTRKIAASQ